MRIGIDISQIAYEKTGVARYVRGLVAKLVKLDKQNEYLFFYSSLRKKMDNSFRQKLQGPKVRIKNFRLPPVLLDLLWNRWHICPIEWFVGDVDIFVTSDWTEPPVLKAKKVTILYDLVIYKHSRETDKKIVEVQKRKLDWVKKDVDLVVCISAATKKDAREILGIEEERLKVVYPGGIDRC